MSLLTVRHLLPGFNDVWFYFSSFCPQKVSCIRFCHTISRDNFGFTRPQQMTCLICQTQWASASCASKILLCRFLAVTSGLNARFFFIWWNWHIDGKTTYGMYIFMFQSLHINKPVTAFKYLFYSADSSASIVLDDIWATQQWTCASHSSKISQQIFLLETCWQFSELMPWKLQTDRALYVWFINYIHTANVNAS